MGTWKEEIIGLFTGAALDIAWERVEWTGWSALRHRWDAASPDERHNIRDALIEIVLEGNNAHPDYGVIIDSVHFAYTQNIWDEPLRHAIFGLSIAAAPQEWQERVGYVKDCYVAGYLASLSPKGAP